MDSCSGELKKNAGDVILNRITVINLCDEEDIMKKSVLALALCLLLGISSAASAANFYLIEDSDVRELEEEELWGWTYEALGFVLNELFARHGYHFEESGKYEEYFYAQEWYTEKPAEVDNSYIYENEMSDVELYNEELIKNVRREMRRMGTINPDGRDVPTLDAEGGVVQPAVSADAAGTPDAVNTPAGAASQPTPVPTPVPTPAPTSTPEPWVGPYSDELHFEEMILDSERPLKVYTGPSERYVRGANGRASVSTNDVIYVAGWDGDWLLVKYWTNSGRARVGYVHKSGLTCEVDAPRFAFEPREVVVAEKCTFTDDPEFNSSILGDLKAGRKVTLLAVYRRNGQWAYIETKVNGRPVRGFVAASCLSEIEE